jgi:hypothetical protein
MKATASFLNLAQPESKAMYGAWLEGLDGDALPDWTVLQGRVLAAIDAYVAEEMARPAAYEIASHEAGGQCRVWFPHYRVRGSAAMAAHMSAILDARLAWAEAHLFHGYVDCHEVHHEPETFLYFQVPYMHLTRAPKAVSAVEDFAHHVGNWVAGIPEWYDWQAHGFRSTWLGTRAVRAFPPYDYQEANHSPCCWQRTD